MKLQNTKKLTVIVALVMTGLILTGCGRAFHHMMHRMDRMHGERFGEMHDFGERIMPFGFGDRGEMMAGVSHIFESTDDGVIYQVIAEDVEDTDTIAMIQERLSQQVEAMNTGMDAATEEDTDADSEEDADVASDDDTDAANNNDADAASDDDVDEEVTDEDSAEAAEDDDEGADESDQKRNGRHDHLEFGRGSFMRGLSEFMGEVNVTYSDLPDGGEIAITSENSDVVEILHNWIEDGPMGNEAGSNHNE